MYRIDHYLGKQVVSQILPFRKENRMFLEPIWNKHHIERIEIVLKETLDAKGRTQFYDQYGVIRDVLQNHLTEVLVLLTMGVPADGASSQEGLRNKLAVFDALQQLGKSSAVIGQYEAYGGEVQEELNKTKDHVSITPTFAGVMVHMGNAQFDGVPIFLISGKMLDERVGYARVLFKNEVFCVQSPDAVHCRPRQIVFYFGHGDLKYPAILVSKNLFRPAAVAEGWKEVTEHEDVGLFGLALSDYHVHAPAAQRDAYELLIAQILQGRKDCFISTETLLASWGFWSPLLASLAHEFPRLYPGGAASGSMLDLQAHGRELAFVSEAVVIPQDGGVRVGVGGGGGPPSFQVMQGKFRARTWCRPGRRSSSTGWRRTCRRRRRRCGRAGSSTWRCRAAPARWRSSSGWRCTTTPSLAPHPRVDGGRALRAPDGARLQLPLAARPPAAAGAAALLQRPPHARAAQPAAVRGGGRRPAGLRAGHRPAGQRLQLPLRAAGRGLQRHTASLFRDTPLAAHGDRLVALTESPVKPHQRMSLTLSAINRAQRVGVLVTGKGKHELITQLSRVKDEPRKYPITGVRPVTGKLVWYIDYDALLG
ncbi:hypothetical protein ANANG_G00246180 [Anguilla anguilla]|uniref:Uncharacterized protein n=1 Tax=Anguilla anguilla TaxID=7936 RepID=A0A9D3LSS3_ANGAN|nr:hypothetical protein ANANG_G00246180 [Anguilla anguilla]